MSDLSSFGEIDHGLDVSVALDRAIADAQGYGGGKIRIPNRGLRISRTVIVPTGVHLEGEGDQCTSISTGGGDFLAVDISGENNGLHGLSIYGSQRGDAAEACVRIKTGTVGTILRDLRIWGGAWGLANSGVDFRIYNCFIQGTGADGGNVVSNGAGRYWDLKCDDGGQPHKYGFWQQWNGSTSDVAENHFFGGDFTGNFTEGSIRIDDQGHNSNVTSFIGCVNNKPILLYSARWTGFVCHEFGADVLKGRGDCSIACSVGFGSGIRASGCKVGPECVGVIS